MLTPQKISNRYQLGQAYFKALYESGQQTTCSPGMLTGYCKTKGHAYLQSTTCGREYCPDCGKDGSPIHARRLNRWIPKVKNLTKVGYLVVTIPEELKKDFHNRLLLRDFRMLLRKKLVRMGYKRGLMRWHYFGDCGACNGQGCDTCEGTGAGRKWNPHLNVILEQGYINDLENSTFRNELKSWLSQFFKRLNGGTPCAVNFNFSYATTENEIAHLVKYVTRSTFRIYQAPTAKLLYRFCSTSSWGKFTPVITTDEALDNNVCPICKKQGVHSPVKWYKLDCKNNYTTTKVIHLKNGNYYRPPNANNNSANTGIDTLTTRIKSRARRQTQTGIRPPGYYAAKRKTVTG